MGAEYCRQYAKQGFNIALISRTKSKMEKVQLELKQINPEIKTMILVADFAGNANINFYESVADQLKTIDMSVLILNAGIAVVGPFEDPTAR